MPIKDQSIKTSGKI